MKAFKISLSLILSLLLVVLTCFSTAFAESTVPTPYEYGFSDCNSIKLEYAIYGNPEAQPLLLLPCNGNDMHGFDGNVLPGLAEHYKVITVSPRGCGLSQRGEGKLTFDVMSEDIYCLLQNLGIEKTYIFGFSDGGNLGIVFTLQHPEKVEKLAVMGSNINTLGTHTFDQIGIVIEYYYLCLKAMITGDSQIALQRDIQGMMVGQPNLTYHDLNQIDIPVLNIYGENDMIKRTHSKNITRAIPNATELMVKGGGHSSCFQYTDTVILPALLDFFG